MSQSRPYRLARQRNLLLVQAAVGGTDGTVLVLRLLLDTGASYTMLPVEAVEVLGRDTLHPLRRIRMVAANGVIVAPLVEMSWFHCLGQRLDNFPVVAHTLPSGTFVDGLLGMDFLSRCGAVVSVAEAEVRCQQD